MKLTNRPKAALRAKEPMADQQIDFSDAPENPDLSNVKDEVYGRLKGGAPESVTGGAQ